MSKCTPRRLGVRKSDLVLYCRGHGVPLPGPPDAVLNAITNSVTQQCGTAGGQGPTVALLLRQVYRS